MTALNHVIGGAAFTAFFCSLHDLNIFSQPQYIAYTVVFSLLPDADHTKSTIGFCLYPIAKILDRKFGHRTITHSLIFYLSLGFLFYILEFFFPILQNSTTIFMYSYLSHLIFDSMTKQAIPLFYPFLKNPTALPANPDLRFNSGDWKIEGIFLAAFVFILAFCQPLYANGFWTTYNRTFATLTHLKAEFRKTEKMTICDFSYSKQGKIFAGNGFVAKAEDNEAQIFVPKQGFFHIIQEECKNIKVLPSKTETPYRVQELFFAYISPDSLQRLLQDKPLIKLHVVANTPITFYKEKKLQSSETCDLDYTYNPTLKFLQDSIKIFDYEDNVEVLHEDINQEQKKFDILKSLITKTNDSIKTLQIEYSKADYTRQTIILQEIELLKSHWRALQIEESRYIKNQKPKIQAKNLTEKIQREKQSKCSGYIAYIVI